MYWFNCNTETFFCVIFFSSLLENLFKILNFIKIINDNGLAGVLSRIFWNLNFQTSLVPSCGREAFCRLWMVFRRMNYILSTLLFFYCVIQLKMSVHAISNSGSIVQQRDCEGILMDNNDAPGVVESLHNRQRVEWR